MKFKLSGKEHYAAFYNGRKGSFYYIDNKKYKITMTPTKNFDTEKIPEIFKGIKYTIDNKTGEVTTPHVLLVDRLLKNIQ